MCSAYWCVVLVVGFFVHNASATVDFTNLKCTNVDKAYNHFEYCLLKSVNRTYKYVSTRVRFHSNELISNISVGIALLRKANGYKPFLYNFTMDGCRYLKYRQSNPVARYFHQIFEKFSNINHTCPFKDYIAVDNMTVSHINHMVTNVLPMPVGEYMLYTTWYTYNIKRTIVQFFVKVY